MSDANEKISRLYRETRVSEPSQQLDDVILEASREAIVKPTRTGPFSGAWPVAASVAAVVIITVILVPVLREDAFKQQTAQEPAEEPLLQEYADEEARVTNSTGAPPKKAASAPSVEDRVLPERNIIAKDRAKTGVGMASSSDTRAQDLHKSSGFSELQSLAPERPDETTTSRMRAADSAPFAALTPEMWETKIERLIEAGEYEKAHAEFMQLKQRFPDYQVNKTLLDKLRP